MKNPEYQLSRHISQYMKWKHPNIHFRFDMAGLNLSMSAATKNKAIQWGRAWPDLFISKPVKPFSGLFIELKIAGTQLKNKKGDWATEHIQEQAMMLQSLRIDGYCATFGIGYDATVEIIEDYLKG